MFTLRFDMRAPEGGASATDLYAAAIEMCSWAEARGAVVAVLSEHHGTDDGHLPVPHILASAIAARTKQLAILLAAVPIPFWDPVRLAEEIASSTSSARGASHTHSVSDTAPRSTTISASTCSSGARWPTKPLRCSGGC